MIEAQQQALQSTAASDVAEKLRMGQSAAAIVEVGLEIVRECFDVLFKVLGNQCF